MKHCDKCNLDFPEHFRFCGACGGGLTDTRECPLCGDLTESKWPFCTGCGHQFSSPAPGRVLTPPSEPGPAKVKSPTHELQQPNSPTQAPLRDTTARYSEPGELYDAGLYPESNSPRTREFADEQMWALDNSETKEIVRDSGYTAPSHASQSRPRSNSPREPIQPITV